MTIILVDYAVNVTHEALFLNHGQSCCAGSRTYVHEKIYDEFVSKTVAKVKSRKVGNPFDKTVLQGPQIDNDMMTKVLSYIESGKQQGAKLNCGGNRIGNVGFFIEPTVFSDVKDEMTIAQEEVNYYYFNKASYVVLNNFYNILQSDFWSRPVNIQI